VRRAPLGQGGLNAPPVQGVTMGLGSVRAITLHEVGFRARPADAATDGCRSRLETGPKRRSEIGPHGTGKCKGERKGGGRVKGGATASPSEVYP
jgi:hypothetical protein